jgi:signal transduction histidine kinase
MVLHDAGMQRSGEMVQEIKDNSVLLMEKMDDIVWSINPNNDSLENLLIRIKRFASRLFEAKGIDYDIHIRENIREIRLPMEFRQHIYLIMKESINNLVKYSQCSRATIDVSFHNGCLQIRIQDNGKGFDTNKEFQGNGMITMHNRATMMKAKMEIQSQSGKGTTVALQVKIK